MNASDFLRFWETGFDADSRTSEKCKKNGPDANAHGAMEKCFKTGLGVGLLDVAHRELPTDLCALGVCTALAESLLCRCLECTETTDFFEDALGFHLVFETLQSAVDRLAFFDFDFWHKIGFVVAMPMGKRRKFLETSGRGGT